jgi:4,5-dihydroxyphthalate decarboxylase
MKIRRVPKDKNIDQMLMDGELDAAIYTEILPSIRSCSPKVGLMFPDAKKAEIEYFKSSGIFPIMHTVVIKNAIVEKHPWVAVSVAQGFQKAKELCYRRMQNPRNFALVWVHELMQEQEAIFGKDPWPYNLEDNRKALEAVVRYAYDEGMIKTKPKIEELFVPSTLQEIGHYLS